MNSSNNSQTNVIIRTNSDNDTVSVNAPLDTVSHYNDVLGVNITAINSASYHEFGSVKGNLVVESGHVTLENSADVQTIIVTEKSDGNNASYKPTVTVQTGSTVSTVVVNTVNEDSPTPQITVEQGATVSSIVPGSNLSEEQAQSVATQVQGVDTTVISTEIVNTETTSLFAGGLGTENSPYIINNEINFYNISTLSEEMGNTENPKRYFFALNNDVDLRKLNNEKQPIFVNSNKNAYISEYFNGVLDGNGYSLYTPEVNDYRFDVFLSANGKAEFKNINYLLNNQVSTICSYVANEHTTLIIDNVDVSAIDKIQTYQLGINSSIILNSFPGTTINGRSGKYSIFKVINCDVDVNISSSDSYNAIFVGGSAYHSSLLVDNCTYSGTYYGDKVAIVLGNATNYLNDLPDEKIIISNITNKGSLFGTNGARLYAASSNDSSITLSHVSVSNCVNGTLSQLTDKTLDIKYDNEKGIVITKGDNNTASYAIQISTGRLVAFKNGKSTGEYSSFAAKWTIEDIVWENNEYVTSLMKGKFITLKEYNKLANKQDINETQWFTINPVDSFETRMAITSINEQIYYVLEIASPEEFEYIFAPVKKNGVFTYGPIDSLSVTIFNYNINGEPIGAKSVSLK